MRVRKRTSKRTTTRMREGIKKKAAAQNRKQRKLDKKDVTWKSRVKKDPGIPAAFPYKNKILEAIEENKRKELEERERMRQERLEAKRAAGEDEDVELEEAEGQAAVGGGLSALVESAQNAAMEYEAKFEDAEMNDVSVRDLDVDLYSGVTEEDTELDRSRKAYDKVFKTVVEAADVVIYVLDARDPEGTRSRKVEEEVLKNQGKRLILLLNKVDLVPNHVVEQWLTFLRASFPTIPFKAASGATNSSSFNKNLTHGATATALLESLKKYANNANLKRSIVVGIVGYPNVGKSSVINALTSQRGGSVRPCPVGNEAGVTTALREVKIDNSLKILDSPGICFPGNIAHMSSSEQVAELALLNAIPTKRIVDPYPAILKLVKRLAKDEMMTAKFKEFYALPPIPAHDPDSFAKQFLIHVARKRGRLGKGGIPNMNSAGISVLNDWRDGKILGWVLPNSFKTVQSESNPQSINSMQPPKKEERITIVQEWSKEFDLENLFASLDNAIKTGANPDVEMDS